MPGQNGPPYSPEYWAAAQHWRRPSSNERQRADMHEPTDLPDGAEVEVVFIDDDLSAEE